MLATQIIKHSIKLINHLVDKEVQQDPRWQPLYNYIIRIESNSPQWICICQITPHGIEVKPEHDDLAHISIQASSLHLIQAAMGNNANQESINISGATEITVLLQEYIQALRINWQALFSPLLGEGLSYACERQGQKIISWAYGSAKKTLVSTGEYLQHESHFCPSKEELSEFCTDVDKLSEQIEKIAADIAGLASGTKANSRDKDV